MSTALSIEVYFDLICPWCWIGKRHRSQALMQMVQADLRLTERWHGVQLLPRLLENGVPFRAFYLDRLGSAQALEMRQTVAVAATWGTTA